ncbi:hypothetical protein Tco_0134749 [Tanacetum coccineum]
MEFFTLVMEKNVRNTLEFNYHFGCKSLKITHICFADDLMVFYHGDPCFVKVIKKTIKDFGNCSGLLPNFGKSIVFFGSINEDEQQILLSILPFVKGNLLIRYLGVPLISKRLGVKDCKSLIDKVNAKTVIKDINRILKNFLWSQSDVSKGQAKVAWKAVCKPKSQGGLGLKDLMMWNKTLLVKHIWNIACKKDTLWVKWVNTVKLGGVSNWVVQKEECDSWGWKSLLTIKDLIKSHILYKIGNEEDTYMWYDNWSVPKITQGDKDKVIWLDNNGIPKKFSMKTVYDDIRDHSEEERNFRIFRSQKRDWTVVMQLVFDSVKTRLMGLKVKKSIAVENAAGIWETFNGLASNFLESSGYDCTHLVVFQLGLGRKLA